MSTQDKIKEKLDEAVRKSYFKPWRKRLSGRILTIALIILIFIALYFAFTFFANLWHLSRGDIYNEDSRSWISVGQYQENQQGISALLTEDDPALGSDEPLIYIVAYESFACPFCKDNQKDIQQVLDKYNGLVRFIFKDFPTESLHPNVFEAHLAAGCAQDQDKFWEYHDVLFANQEQHTKSDLKKYAENLGLNTAEFDACLDNEEHAQEIRQDFAQGVDLGVVGTPSYVINGQLVPGEIPFDIWEQILAYLIQQEL